MASESVGFYYSKTTGRLRWILSPDNDSEITASLNDGEALEIVARDDWRNAAVEGGDSLQALLSSITKITPKDDRHALVDKTGAVIATTFLCVDCGDVAPKDLIVVKSDEAAIGDKFVDGLLVKPPIADAIPETSP